MTRSNRKTQDGPSQAAGDLLIEIEALRELIARVLELAAEERPAGELLRLMEGLSRASARLADLLLAQKKLNAEQSGAQVLRALEELNRDFRRESKK